MVGINGDLPEDLLTEILSRLPVKSLRRLKCVCKFLYNLVENPKFIYKHLRKDDNTRLIVRYHTEPDVDDNFHDPKYFFSLILDKNLSDLSLQELHPEMPGMILGPFDGIFCLFESYSFITLWNLATREYRVLPKCRATLRQNTIVNSSNVGFGLDPLSNDFKLVLIFTLFDKKRSVLCDFSHVVVYNLSTNSWRNLEGFDMNYDFLLETFDSTYLNGVCYWLTKQDFQFKVILSFDMSNEAFQEIQYPSSIPESADRTLGLHIDSLAVLVLNENYFEIWIKQEKCWTKHLSVGPFIEVEKPLAFWKKGSFLVESSTGDLLLYDPITREMRNLGLQNCWFAVLYKENLLTVKGG